LGNIGITLSAADPAGINILKAFRKFGFEETTNSNILRNENTFLFVLEHLIVPAEKYKTPINPSPYPADYDALAKEYSIDYYVVASRHWSRSGTPTLTVHPTGNFGKAMYGGRNFELQSVPANPMRNVFLEILKDPPLGYAVSLEATHHSPTQFETPMFFAELGSSKRQWQDEAAAEYLAKSIVKGIGSRSQAPITIGFGGGHYCPIFTVMERETAFGHICPKYALDLLSEGLIRQMVIRTIEHVDKAVIEKGLKGYQRKKVEVALRRLSVEFDMK
jgi:D-aminoacyl-tRNA deacylase